MSKTQSYAIAFAAFSLLSIAQAADAPKLPLKAADFIVVLDPGHGGTDLGATYREDRPKTPIGEKPSKSPFAVKPMKGTLRSEYFTEKDAVLGLAKETKRQLEKKGYPVLLTRDRDADIALNARTAIANRAGAKIFVSIHMNSLPSAKNQKGAEGVETYILNSTSDRTSTRLAELENKGLDPTQGSKTTGQTEVNLILKDMVLDGNISESKRLACAFQGHLTDITKQKARGVKQAMFVVLLGADMPSTLIEAGFVTSDNDRKLITSEHGVRAMGAALVRAIEQFRLNQGTEAAQQELNRCLVSEH